MAKKLRYELSKVSYVDNDIVRYSDAFRQLNSTQINLFLYLCCLAKQQYDIELDENSNGKATGWSNEIRIDMIEFCKSSGNKTNWYDLPKEKKDIILGFFKELQEKSFTIYNSKRRTLSEGFESYNYIEHISYRKNILRIRMDESTRLFFMNYDSFFTPYEIGQVIQLKSEISKLLYIYLRSFWNDNTNAFLPTSLSLDHFREIIGKTKCYPEYKDLKRHVIEKAIAEINEKTDIIISGDNDVYRRLTKGKDYMTPEEIAKYRIRSMEMHTDDEHRRSVTGLTFRMKMKPIKTSVNYYDSLFSDEMIEERMRNKAIVKKLKQKSEEVSKYKKKA